jgi:hypothetical protein
MVLASTLESMGLIIKDPNFKLQSLCETLDIETPTGEFHNALTDVHQTIKCYDKLKDILRGRL